MLSKISLFCCGGDIICNEVVVQPFCISYPVFSFPTKMVLACHVLPFLSSSPVIVNRETLIQMIMKDLKEHAVTTINN